MEGYNRSRSKRGLALWNCILQPFQICSICCKSSHAKDVASIKLKSVAYDEQTSILQNRLSFNLKWSHSGSKQMPSLNAKYLLTKYGKPKNSLSCVHPSQNWRPGHQTREASIRRSFRSSFTHIWKKQMCILLLGVGGGLLQSFLEAWL